MADFPKRSEEVRWTKHTELSRSGLALKRTVHTCHPPLLPPNPHHTPPIPPVSFARTRSRTRTYSRLRLAAEFVQMRSSRTRFLWITIGTVLATLDVSEHWSINVQALLAAFIFVFFSCRAVFSGSHITQNISRDSHPNDFPCAFALLNAAAFVYSNSDGQGKIDAEELANVKWLE